MVDTIRCCQEVILTKIRFLALKTRPIDDTFPLTQIILVTCLFKISTKTNVNYINVLNSVGVNIKLVRNNQYLLEVYYKALGIRFNICINERELFWHSLCERGKGLVDTV